MSTAVQLNACVFHRETQSLEREGSLTHLSPKEARVLAYLCDNPNIDLPREQLYRDLWEEEPKSRALDVIVRQLRKKIEANPARPAHIVGVHGVGYRFVLSTQKSRSPSQILERPDLYVGREVALKTLREKLQKRGSCTLIHGPGGMGKTRFVRHSLQTWNGPGPAQFIDCSNCTTEEGLHHVLSSALGLSAPPGRTREDNRRTLGRTLSGRGDRLLVLDNLEQLQDDIAPFLEDIRTLAPAVRWLLTSRTRIELSGIQQIQLKGLSPQESLALLQARLALHMPSLRLSPAECDEAVRLCAWLGGLPLAIEMVASRLPVFNATDIRHALAESTAQLRLHQRDLPERHRSMNAAIAWSWNLLSEDEQKLLLCAAPFAGHFGAAKLQEVLDDAPELEEIDSTLERLQGASMLAAHPSEGTRSVQHFPLIRAWLLDTLRERPENQSIPAAHAAYFLSLAKRCTEKIPGPQAHAARLDLHRNLADLLGAQAWFLDREDEKAVLLLLAVHTALWRRGSFLLQKRIVDEAVSLADKTQIPSLQVQARIARCDSMGRRGWSERVNSDLEEAIELLDGLNNGALLAEVLHLKARSQDSLGHLQEACTICLQALELPALKERPELDARIRITLTHVYKGLGDGRTASKTLNLALARIRDSGDRELEALMQSTAALVASSLGDVDQMGACLKRAIQLHEELGNQISLATALGNQAVLQFRTGLWREALDSLDRVSELALANGDHATASLSMGNRASVFMSREQWDQAEVELTKALSLSVGLGKPELEGAIRCVFGVLSHTLEQHARAESDLLRALGLLGPQSPYRCRALAHLGALWAESGRLDQAKLAFHQARSLPGAKAQRESLLIRLLEATVLLASSQTHAQFDQAQRVARNHLEEARSVNFSDELETAVQILRRVLRRSHHSSLREASA